MGARHSLTIYFDTAEQLRQFKVQAALQDMSASQYGKTTLIQAHNLGSLNFCYAVPFGVQREPLEGYASKDDTDEMG
jgi:hypothetical protein